MRRPAFHHDQAGVAAVEFALIAPILGIILAVAVDFGGVLYARFKLDAAVAAGANYAQVNAASVSSAGAATLASSIATVVAAAQGTASADDTVVVNNGPSATVSGGTQTASGTASPADQCYCPTGTASSLTWGTAQTCGGTCTGGGVAGKFVTITAARSYSPLFSTYGVVRDSTISVAAVVQTQ